MKTIPHRLTVTCLLAGLALGWVLPAAGQADKWVQLPDLQPTGIDINARDYRLADDFPCDTPGPITNVIVWGSWWIDDYPSFPPTNLAFTLRIRADIPAGESPSGYSMPTNALWSRYFEPGDFTAALHATALQEGWLDPPDQLYPFSPGLSGDTNCWLYAFPIPREEAFVQQGTAASNVVYWLEVQAHTPKFFGWKTSVDNWNDAAVWWDSGAGGWGRMVYPLGFGHPFEGQNVDLAFHIQSGSFTPPSHKWEQRPDLAVTGIDVDAMWDIGYSYRLADDFLCAERGLLTDITIWGSWWIDALPGGDAGNVEFTLMIFDDVPADQSPTGYSMPAAAPLWQRSFGPGEFSVALEAGGIHGGWLDPPTSYSANTDTNCWRYTFAIPPGNAFEQLGSSTSNRVYWLAVQASNTVQSSTWFGWKTSMDHWNDNAVWSEFGSGWNELSYVFSHPWEGEAVDLAFSLDSQPSPPPADAKWYQPPDLSPDGMDVYATRYQEFDPEALVLADDFLCEATGLITGVVVYASWYHDVLPFGDDPHAATIVLSLYSDDPGGPYSRPDQLLWAEWFEGDFTAERYAEDLHEGWFNPSNGVHEADADWTCWKLTFNIDTNIAFRQLGSIGSPITYWLGVQFWTWDWDQATRLGWKTSTSNWNDTAVWVQELAPYSGTDWAELIHPTYGPLELAFEIHGEQEQPPPQLLDWGDAPDGIGGPWFYPTKLTSNGARHTIDPALFLGNGVDDELAGQPHFQALGDDVALVDDEDGVTFTSPLIAGATSTVEIVASQPGLLNAWIDFDGNGQWDPSDQVFTDKVLGGGMNPLSIVVPGTAPLGISYARFRFSTVGGLTPVDLAADGEVEDYQVSIWEDDTKWAQQPDTSREGVDVDASGTDPFYMTLADDFLCRESGLITNIQVWGSWFNESYPFGSPANVDFVLRIYDDIPAGVSQTGYSMPGSVVWSNHFAAGAFGLSDWAQGLQEDFWTPVDQYHDTNDFTCWQYTFLIDASNAFHQAGTPQSNVVYWLEVTAIPLDGVARFGWKSSLEHWNDDAVFRQLPNPPDDWYELAYPPPNAFNGSSMDLAFRIMGSPAEPQQEEDFDYKWLQPPDLSPLGMDVNATFGDGFTYGMLASNVLADDFLCTMTGPITNIVVWGSWKDDLSDSADFAISIYSDLPASNSPSGYSMPDQLLHTWYFGPGEPLVELEAEGIEEGWYDPVTGEEIFPPGGIGDTNCWRYTFPLDTNEVDQLFVQQGSTNNPVVYWLAVQAWPYAPGTAFGWKTSTTNWNDDAVWGVNMVFGEDPFPLPPNLHAWNEMHFPPTHPRAPESIDLAFAVYGTGGEPPPPVLRDYGDAPEPSYPTLEASGGARHHVNTNFCLGLLIDAETDGFPHPNALGDDTNNIADEDGVFLTSLLVPGSMASVDVVASSNGALDAWIDFGADGSWADPGDQIFSGEPLVPGTNALAFPVPPTAAGAGTTFARFRLSEYGGLLPDGPGGDGEVEDYEVYIEEGPGLVGLKWLQPPDLSVAGVDVHATYLDFGPLVSSNILADDFLCSVTGPISNIVVWGSWKHDNVDSPDFAISIYSDIPETNSPSGYSMPDQMLYSWLFVQGEYETQLEAEGIQEGWYDPVPPEYLPIGDSNCWRYSFTMDPQDTFVQQGSPSNPIVYWIAVQAWPYTDTAIFGWKSSSSNWNDDAVWGVNTGWGLDPVPAFSPFPWNELRFPPGHPREPQSLDLAFAVFGGGEEPQPDPHDFGDTPTNYPTILAHDGARHRIEHDVYLGFGTPDVDADGQPSPSADGDDFDLYWDDEDGVFMSPFLTAGSNETVQVVASTAGYLNAWFDFNADLDWTDSGEQVASNAVMIAGTNNVTVPVPGGAPVGFTYARFRFSSYLLPGLSFTGGAPDGEVEDYFVEIMDQPGPTATNDFGDAPAPYPTLSAADGARHVAGTYLLGSMVDIETNGLPDPNALGDDLDNMPDEDGVVFVPPLYVGQQGAVEVVALTPGTYLDAWVDFHADGSWATTGDLVFASLPLSVGTNVLVFPVPASAVATQTFARFRSSSSGGLSFTGLAVDGEVEDYEVTVQAELVPELCLKWRQDPDCLVGRDMASWRLEAEPIRVKVADDWRCDGRPVAGVEWWGSYIGYQPGEAVETNPPPQQPLGFVLTWYTDIPVAAGNPFSRPGAGLATNFYPLTTGGGMQPLPGTVTEYYACSSEVGGVYEHEFGYFVQFPAADVWNEKEGRIYWLSVEAVYSGTVDPVNPWGWATTPIEFNRFDDAVRIAGGITNKLEYATPHPYEGDSVNMAYRLYTDICPRRAKMWTQMPDMVHGTNMASWRVLPDSRPGPWLRADDFVHDGRRIGDVHWWGSYIGWKLDEQGSEAHPVPPPFDPFRPVRFELMFQTNDPACLPSPVTPTLLVVAPIEMCHETFYGTVAHYWGQQPGVTNYEHEYQYYLDLQWAPDSVFEWMQPGGHYWLSIQAVYGYALQEDPLWPWGWKITEDPGWTNCPSVVIDPAMGVWQPGVLAPPVPQHSNQFDLAFELTTAELGPAPWYDPIEITDFSVDISSLGSNRFRIYSLGDWGAGWQYLQGNTDLVNGTWYDLQANPSPVAPGDQNYWYLPRPRPNPEYYRIQQRMP